MNVRISANVFFSRHPSDLFPRAILSEKASVDSPGGSGYRQLLMGRKGGLEREEQTGWIE
jgi:hypothetical protein